VVVTTEGSTPKPNVRSERAPSIDVFQSVNDISDRLSTSVQGDVFSSPTLSRAPLVSSGSPSPASAVVRSPTKSPAIFSNLANLLPTSWSRGSRSSLSPTTTASSSARSSRESSLSERMLVSRDKQLSRLRSETVPGKLYRWEPFLLKNCIETSMRFRTNLHEVCLSFSYPCNQYLFTLWSPCTMKNWRDHTLAEKPQLSNQSSTFLSHFLDTRHSRCQYCHILSSTERLAISEQTGGFINPVMMMIWSTQTFDSLCPRVSHRQSFHSFRLYG